jgi:hypothetical protein
MAASPDILIHVGIPKTATTTFQFELFAKHNGVNFFGKPYWNEEVGYEQSHAVARLLELIPQESGLDYSVEQASALYEQGVAPRLDEERLNVFSEEALTGAGSVDRRLIAMRLKDLFPTAKILVTIREQKKALFSLHRWLATRALTNLPPNQWLASLNTFDYYRAIQNDFYLRQYDFVRIFYLYTELFGRDNVCILPTETLNDTIRVAGILSDFCGMNAGETIKCFENATKQNVSPGYLGMKYQRLVKKGLGLAKRFKPCIDTKPWGLFDEGIHKTIMSLMVPVDRPPQGFSEDSCRRIDDYYAKGNKILSQETGLDLRSMGYPVV